jgi:hypothetical protein
MWEVYAMWTWMAVFVAASEHARRGTLAELTGPAALVTFAVGAVGRSDAGSAGSTPIAGAARS